MYPGTDLTALVAGKKWATLTDLIHQLPQASRTWGAVMNDPELAEQIVAAQNRDGRLNTSEDADDFADDEAQRPGWNPPYAEFDLHAKMLSDVINALAGLNQTVAAVAGGKPRRPDAYPTPLTALPEAQKHAAAADAEAIYEHLGIRDNVTNQ